MSFKKPIRLYRVRKFSNFVLFESAFVALFCPNTSVRK